MVLIRVIPVCVIPILALVTLGAASPAHAAGHDGTRPSGEGHGMPDLSNAPPNDRHGLALNVLMRRCARRQQEMQQNRNIPGNDRAVARQCRQLDQLTRTPREYQLTQPQ